MASELSRLIDDELVKFERRPSVDEKPKRSSFNIKSPATKQDWLSRFSWGHREWWTWKRIGYAILAGLLVFGTFYIWANVGSATPVDGGSSSLQSKTESSQDTPLQEASKSHITHKESSSINVTPATPGKSHGGRPNATHSGSAVNVTAPSAFGPSITGAVGKKALAPSLLPSEAPGPQQGGALGFAPATAPLAGAMSPGPAAAEVKPALAPARLSPQGAPSPSKNATAARPPVTGMKFDMGGQAPLKKSFGGRKM